jgi:uncharacterized membrane protein YphA (DoxX/SURF4 family)
VPNPFSDFWDFLIGNTGDYDALGSWKYLFVVLFVTLIAASAAIAVENWWSDPTQRTGAHLATCVMRVMVGGMWFQGMLWKLPLPISDGLKFWVEQMGERAAFGFQRNLATNFYLPYLHILNPIVFLAELTFAVSLTLGLGTRLVSVLAIIFVLHLWLGIYAPGDPAEWPWSYVFLAMVLFMFALHGAGRSLGADALIGRHRPTGLLGRLAAIAG